MSGTASHESALDVLRRRGRLPGNSNTLLTSTSILDLDQTGNRVFPVLDHTLPPTTLSDAGLTQEISDHLLSGLKLKINLTGLMANRKRCHDRVRQILQVECRGPNVGRVIVNEE